MECYMLNKVPNTITQEDIGSSIDHKLFLENCENLENDVRVTVDKVTYGVDWKINGWTIKQICCPR